MGYFQLVGEHEPFSDTLRKWTYQQWGAEAPIMASQFGHNATDTELTENDWKGLMKDRSDYISFRDGEINTLSSANHWAERTQTVYIDIFSETRAAKLAKRIDEIIISEPMPEIPKTDGMTSAILGFYEYAADWTVISKSDIAGMVSQYAGSVDVIFQITNS